MKKTFKIALVAMPILLLAACGGSGDSNSGSGADPAPTPDPTAPANPTPADPAPADPTPADPAPVAESLKISCARTPNALVATGDNLTANFSVTPAGSGTAKLYKTCANIVTSTETVIVTNGKFTAKSVMPASCADPKTYALVLGMGDAVGSCGWARTLGFVLPDVTIFPDLVIPDFVLPGI